MRKPIWLNKSACNSNTWAALGPLCFPWHISFAKFVQFRGDQTSGGSNSIYNDRLATPTFSWHGTSFVQHISRISPVTKVRSAQGNTTSDSANLLHISLWAASANLPLMLWAGYLYPVLTRVKLWRPAGHVTLSRFWLKCEPKVKLWRPAGHVMLSLNFSPKVKLWRPAGHVTLSKLWLKLSPKVKLCRPVGHVTSSRLWLKRQPKVKLWRLAGHVTVSRFW